MLSHLGDSDSRGRSRESRLAGFELTDWTEVSLSKAVDASDSEPVGLTWTQLLLLPALVVLRPWQLLLEEAHIERTMKRVHMCTTRILKTGSVTVKSEYAVLLSPLWYLESGCWEQQLTAHSQQVESNDGPLRRVF